MTTTGAITRIRESVLKAAYARTMAMPIERTEHACFPVTVSAVRDLAPQLRRLTLTARELAHYRPLGPDEYFGLVMPRPRQPLPDLAGVAGTNLRATLADLPEQVRPDLRWYTVRAHRPWRAEVDVDVVTHGDEGPGSRWVRRAEVGSVAAFQTGAACYRLRSAAGAGDQVLAGDETALPAISAILEQVSPAVRPHVFLELPSVAAVGELPQTPEGRLVVLERGDAAPGSALLPALAAADLPELGFGWVCGERATATQVRRHLVEARGLDRRAVYFCGYWVRGRPRG